MIISLFCYGEVLSEIGQYALIGAEQTGGEIIRSIIMNLFDIDSIMLNISPLSPPTEKAVQGWEGRWVSRIKIAC